MSVSRSRTRWVTSRPQIVIGMPARNTIVGGFRIALDIVLGLLHPECPAHDVEVTQGLAKESSAAMASATFVNGPMANSSRRPRCSSRPAEQVRRGDALIDLHPIEPGNALTLVPCPPDRPAAQRLSGPDPDRDGPAFHLVENQAGHPGPQDGISVDRRHPDELHSPVLSTSSASARRSSTSVPMSGIEEDGTSHV